MSRTPVLQNLLPQGGDKLDGFKAGYYGGHRRGCQSLWEVIPEWNLKEYLYMLRISDCEFIYLLIAYLWLACFLMCWSPALSSSGCCSAGFQCWYPINYSSSDPPFLGWSIRSPLFLVTQVTRSTQTGQLGCSSRKMPIKAFPGLFSWSWWEKLSLAFRITGNK